MNIQPLVQQEIKIPQAINNGIANVGESINNIKTGITNSINQFSEKTQAGIGASNEFLKSNTIVAKIAFIFLVLILFLFLMSLGIMLIGYFTQPANNPYLINGMIDGTYPTIVTQDPNNKKSLLIQRSNNQSKGMEFTWSFWIFVNDLGSAINNKAQHVFNKGNNAFDQSLNIATVNNSPGVYIIPNNGSLTLAVLMDTVDSNSNSHDMKNKIIIDNLPIRKWFNVVIRLENLILDVYVNGTISSRLILNGVPKQNYNDVNICQNGGFSGNLSNLRYFDYALNIFEINNILSSGPNLSVVGNLSSNAGYTYLSNVWYSNKL
jgi:hypothetical protein